MPSLLVSNCGAPCGCAGGCKAVNGTFTDGSSPDAKTWWFKTTLSTPLVNPSGCSIILSFYQGDPGVSQGAPQNHPGLMAGNAFQGHDFSAFDWTYTIVYDGVTIYTESGHFPGGSTIPFGWAYLPFSNPGWYSTGTYPNQQWNWDYTGPASSNLTPTVTITFVLVGTDSLYFWPDGMAKFVYYTE